jgi:hypothetical protein
VNGIVGQVDCDRFLGTLAELQALGGPPPPPPALPTIPHVNGNDALTVLNFPDDGHAEVFASSTSGRIEGVATNGNSENWTSPADRGSGGCGVASAVWGTAQGPSVSMFDSMASGTQEQSHSGAQWDGFATFGGVALDHLTTIAGTDGHVEVFGLAPDGSIARNARGASASTWDGWSSLGGTFATGAGPVVWNDGHIEIFATDAQGNAWHDWTQGASWHGWAPIGGGPIASRPTPVRWADGHVEIFARGADAHLWHSSGTASNFPALVPLDTSEDLAGAISAIDNSGTMGGPAGPELFARTSSGQAVHASWTGSSWTPWTAMPAVRIVSDPLGWIRTGGMGEAFAVNASGDLVKTYRAPDGSWTPWVSIATGIEACNDVQQPPAADGGAMEGGASRGDGGASSDAAGSADDGGSDTAEEAAAPPPLLPYDAGPPLSIPSQANGETQTNWWGSQAPTRMGNAPGSGCASGGVPRRGEGNLVAALYTLVAVLGRQRVRHPRTRLQGVTRR